MLLKGSLSISAKQKNEEYSDNSAGHPGEFIRVFGNRSRKHERCRIFIHGEIGPINGECLRFFPGRSDFGKLTHRAEHVGALDITDKGLHNCAGEIYRRNPARKRVILGVPVK